MRMDNPNPETVSDLLREVKSDFKSPPSDEQNVYWYSNASFFFIGILVALLLFVLDYFTGQDFSIRTLFLVFPPLYCLDLYREFRGKIAVSKSAQRGVIVAVAVGAAIFLLACFGYAPK